MSVPIGEIETPTFSQAFAEAMSAAMSGINELAEGEPSASDATDDGKNMLILLKGGESLYLYCLFPTDPQHPQGTTRLIGLEKNLPDEMTAAERNHHMFFLGEKETRTGALILAAMFSDVEERVALLPTVASLLGGQGKGA